ncbi:unnamed protein product [Leptidea sinapis]|uniref:Uncharacterized protein n=1 Tax=Leptidea sinapis TaxID=189913 RepID=A0A5E4PK86_9NEOP|nr:unnamed protein product [Leptidea sinapis]
MFSWSYCEDFHDGEIWNQKGMAKGVKHSQEAWLRLYRRLTVQDLCTNVVVSPGDVERRPRIEGGLDLFNW